jgi:transposase-like protein
MSDVDTSGAKRRRNKRWPEALKREIVSETYLPGGSRPRLRFGGNVVRGDLRRFERSRSGREVNQLGQGLGE